MSRHDFAPGFFDAVDAPPRTALEQQAELIAAKPRRVRAFGLAPAAIRKAGEETAAMASTGAWDGARGVHLVALYAWLHQQVYGVEAGELSGVGQGSAAVKAAQVEWAAASVSAQKFCAKEFGGEFAECVEFMRWAWRREEAVEKKRRSGESTSDFRMGWRYQFSARLATDHRIAAARKHSR
jgi:hypothetical protein